MARRKHSNGIYRTENWAREDLAAKIDALRTAPTPGLKDVRFARGEDFEVQRRMLTDSLSAEGIFEFLPKGGASRAAVRRGDDPVSNVPVRIRF